MKQFDAEMVVYAQNILKQHPITDLMVRIFLPKDHYRFFALIYAYLRWLDDEIDEDRLSSIEKEELLTRAYSFMQSSNGYIPQYNEMFLLEVLNFSDTYGLPSRKPIQQMTTSIDLDMKRIGKIPDREELDRLCLLRVCSYLNMLKILTKDGLLMDVPPNYGIACDEVHILRDFDEDFSRGIFNFSSEDVKSYGLVLGDRTHPSWNLWFCDRIENAGNLLKAGYMDLLKMRPSRYTGMCLLNLSKYWKNWLDLKAKHACTQKRQ